MGITDSGEPRASYCSTDTDILLIIYLRAKINKEVWTIVLK